MGIGAFGESAGGWMVVIAAVAVLASALPAAGQSAPSPSIASVSQGMPSERDYTYSWWANGFPYHYESGKKIERGGEQVICFQTGYFGLAVDAQKVQVLHMGPIGPMQTYDEAVSGGTEAIDPLPPAALTLSIQSGDKRYTCRSAAANQRDPWEFPIRLIEGGRWFQRMDIERLVFQDEQGNTADVQGRLEISAWPDRLSLMLEVVPNATIEAGKVEIVLGYKGKDFVGTTRADFRPGVTQSASISLMPAGEDMTADDGKDLEVQVKHMPQEGPIKPLRRAKKYASTVATQSQPASMPAVTASYDSVYGWHRIELVEPKNKDYYSRVKLSLVNRSDQPRTFRLLLAKDDGAFPIVGASPMIRDGQGNPTGIPVQISKNWHSREGRTFKWQGYWFHGLTAIRVPAGGRLDCEVTIAYAYWGTLPAVSHAQLCLIGWGHNDIWDQVAIGSWGESICYEPERVQRRNMIDDIRPLLVYGMRERKEGNWTNNVGGGDFLVYFDEKGAYQHLRGVKAAYEQYGPNLTRAVYSSRTADGRIACRMEASSPRCDDLNRAYHRFRYDVLKPTPFTRLAFYQLGADHYLGHSARKIARGDTTGLKEEWDVQELNNAYLRRDIPCDGDGAWFSLHQAVPAPKSTGPWADRGLVIRSWKARLGGKDAAPFAAIYSAENGKNTIGPVLELSPPPGVTELKPGDFVEAEVEILIMPQAAEDYYGPNENLRASLAQTADTWKPIHRQAAGNNLKVGKIAGQLLSSYPPVIELDKGQKAVIEITGGVGYVPITFVRLVQVDGYELLADTGDGPKAVNQGRSGNDFWQMDFDPRSRTWRRTYNISLDSPGDAPRTVRLTFHRLPVAKGEAR